VKKLNKEVKLKIYAPPERIVSYMARLKPESRADESVLDLDRRQYLGWTEYIQEGQFRSSDVRLESELTTRRCGCQQTNTRRTRTLYIRRPSRCLTDTRSMDDLYVFDVYNDNTTMCTPPLPILLSVSWLIQP
jgi:hypothetical protein